MSYRYALDGDVAESILNLSARQRDELIRVFRSLADDPFQLGETSFADSSLRSIQKKRYGRWIISYWPDDPVKELRIVGVQRAAR